MYRYTALHTMNYFTTAEGECANINKIQSSRPTYVFILEADI